MATTCYGYSYCSTATTATATVSSTTSTIVTFIYDLIVSFVPNVLVELVLAPLWFCVGVVKHATETLYGFAAKAPFRLIVYDS